MLVSYKNATICQQNGSTVLDHVDFKVDESEFVYLMGRVGSGKSSLLKTIYFELDIDEADEAVVLGKNLKSLRRKDIPALRRQMGIIFQDFQLLTDRTVYKNLRFVLRATGWRKDEVDDRIEEVLTLVGMKDKMLCMPHELSGGRAAASGHRARPAEQPEDDRGRRAHGQSGPRDGRQHHGHPATDLADGHGRRHVDPQHAPARPLSGHRLSLSRRQH